MRRALALLVLVLLAAIPLGCGGSFELPTEHPKQIVPTDQSYAMLSTWKGLNGVQDLLITQGQGNQLFVLFNIGGSGPSSVPRGGVILFPLTNPIPIGPPYFDPMRTLFNPVAFAASMVMCVYAPAPETSPPSPYSSVPRWLACPQKIGFL